jgi:uncharacterized integral membrane protein (TIGR00698 family)
LNITKSNSYEKIKKGIFITGAILCFLPFVDPSIALLGGFTLTLIFGNPFSKFTKGAANSLLQASIVGLGFGMNIFDAVESGKNGLLFVVSSIFITLLVGLLLGKLFSIKKKINVLISVGTAICGGSAIAAIAPVIDAKEEETSIALATIFVLNSVALFLFPLIGEWLVLSQHQFGLWSAIAIHDTSSVVGAAQKYGEEALTIATSIKLERALWIIPVSLITALSFKNEKKRIKIPYFILLFVVAMSVNTFMPLLSSLNLAIVHVSKKILTLTLFLIGAGLTWKSIQKASVKPLLQGILLWVFISATSLLVILKIVS